MILGSILNNIIVIMQLMKISILGITGKMGNKIAELITSSNDMQLVGGTTSSNNVLKGQELYGITVDTDLTSAFQNADVLIDFSSPIILPQHLEYATRHKKPLLIGTTGLNVNHDNLLKISAKTVPILQASNTSIGITLLCNLVKVAAQKLDLSYDVEILETHHREKIDAPSGTALELGKAVATGRKIDLKHVKSFNRRGVRKQGEIGFSSLRGGGIFGEHTIRFLGDDEVIEFSHVSLNRRLFAKGALCAARWLATQKQGLYTMQDVLNYDI